MLSKKCRNTIRHCKLSSRRSLEGGLLQRSLKSSTKVRTITNSRLNKTIKKCIVRTNWTLSGWMRSQFKPMMPERYRIETINKHFNKCLCQKIFPERLPQSTKETPLRTPSIISLRKRVASKAEKDTQLSLQKTRLTSIFRRRTIILVKIMEAFLERIPNRTR